MKLEYVSWAGSILAQVSTEMLLLMSCSPNQCCRSKHSVFEFPSGPMKVLGGSASYLLGSTFPCSVVLAVAPEPEEPGGPALFICASLRPLIHSDPCHFSKSGSFCNFHIPGLVGLCVLGEEISSEHTVATFILVK